jgi:DNA-binding NarL/FixJ family response regulator
MFRDLIVESIASRRPLDVIAEFDDSSGIEAQLRAAAPELVLLELRPDQDDGAALALAQIVPHAMLIAFSDGARNAFVFRGRTRRATLIDFSAQALIQTIDDG